MSSLENIDMLSSQQQLFQQLFQQRRRFPIKMVALEYHDIYGPCIITTLSAIQQVNFGLKYERAKKRYKIPLLENSPGEKEENFLRIQKAYQHTVEMYPVFLGGVWSSSLLLHQGPSVALGLLYIVARSKYFRGYTEAAPKRIPGYKLCTFSLLGMTVCSFVGVGGVVLSKVLGDRCFPICFVYKIPTNIVKAFGKEMRRDLFEKTQKMENFL